MTSPSVDSSIVEKPEPSKLSTGKPAQSPQSNDQTSDQSTPQPNDKNGEDTGGPATSNFLLFAAMPSWLTSLILHVIALLLLALVALPTKMLIKKTELTLNDSESIRIEEDMPVFELNEHKLDDSELNLLEAIIPNQPDTDVVSDEAIISDANDLDSAMIQSEVTPLGLHNMAQSEAAIDDGAALGSGFHGRGHMSRERLVREAGGTKESEMAVQLALKWLQSHQNQDGSWSFRHANGQCACPDHGTHMEAVNGATAMALLPFLGAGHTHAEEGKYQDLVKRGLYFLLTRQKANGSFAEARGNLYSHGLCTIVLSEAYAMTNDKDLFRPTQMALNYIAFAQDPIGGGWRYAPKQPGDTSVVGWQLMALKSGKMAYLTVDPRVLLGAQKFLDFVQTDEGSGYGYKDPGDRLATSSIGLLCRMYMGWDREHPALVRGVERLSKSGPSKVDMYYNYYATQVLRHYEGDLWVRWNKKMRNFLVETQAKKGHMTGSWQMGNSHAATAGGRLYNTALATMVLEVYYRHLPIYRQQATEDDFEL